MQKQFEGFCISIASAVQKLLAWWSLQIPMYICPPNDKRPALQRMRTADPSAPTTQIIEDVKSECQHRLEDKEIPKDPMRLNPVKPFRQAN
jgi:hypothetical protein